jgi:hypothetical protein
MLTNGGGFRGAMIVVDGLTEEGFGIGEGAGALFGEEEFGVVLERGLIAFDGEEVIGAFIADFAGDLLLTSHGVDSHRGTGEFEHLEQAWDGDNLVFLSVDRFLTRDDARLGSPSRDHVQGRASFPGISGAPRGFAIQRHHGRAIVHARSICAQALCPGDETVSKGLCLDRIEKASASTALKTLLRASWLGTSRANGRKRRRKSRFNRPQRAISTKSSAVASTPHNTSSIISVREYSTLPFCRRSRSAEKWSRNDTVCCTSTMVAPRAVATIQEPHFVRRGNPGLYDEQCRPPRLGISDPL